MANTFSLVFAGALAVMLALRVWLALRQISYVNAHRATVPAQFSGRVTLAAHQKAVAGPRRERPPRHPSRPIAVGHDA